MKKIEIQNNFFLSRDFYGSYKHADEENQEYQNNAKTIIFAVAYIEFIMAGVINYYFFKNENEKSDKFDELFLSSSFFYFSDKMKTIINILRSCSLVDKKYIADLESQLRKSMMYRNMFTHGRAIFNTGNCVLHYYEGGKKVQEYDDIFLTKIESELKASIRIIEEVSLKMKSI